MLRPVNIAARKEFSFSTKGTKVKFVDLSYLGGSCFSWLEVFRLGTWRICAFAGNTSAPLSLDRLILFC
jgi:hypothetical protein